MRPCVFALVMTAALLGQDADESEDIFLDRWTRWSRETLETWRKAKLLHGNDLDRAKRLAGSIDVAWIRFRRAERIDKCFSEADRTAFDRILDAIWADSKRKAKDELKKIRKDLQVKCAAFVSQKVLLGQIGREFESLRVLMNARLVDAKSLKDAEKKEFQKHVAEIEAAAKVCTTVAQWQSGIEERIMKTIGLIDELLEDLAAR